MTSKDASVNIAAFELTNADLVKQVNDEILILISMTEQLALKTNNEELINKRVDARTRSDDWRRCRHSDKPLLERRSLTGFSAKKWRKHRVKTPASARS